MFINDTLKSVLIFKLKKEDKKKREKIIFRIINISIKN